MRSLSALLLLAACSDGAVSPPPPSPDADAGELSDAGEAAPDAAGPDDAGSGHAPQPSLAADPTSGTAALLVRFDGSFSRDEDGDLSRYAWDFGDGASAEGAMVEHTYSRPGSYEATLTVSDAAGNQASARVSISVSLAACPSFARGATHGALGSNLSGQLAMLLNEVSGLAASRRDPEILWVHNDSGDGPRIYATDSHGAVRAGYELSGAQAVDWEDIAIGPGPQAGIDYLYVGDIGDNDGVSDIAPVYRIAEPGNVPAPTATPSLIRVRAVDTFVLEYGGGRSFNAETMMVDPRTGDLFIATKSDTGRSTIFRAPAASLTPNARVLLEELATLNLQGEATGGDISPSGEIVIRTYAGAFLWRRPEGLSVADALSQPPCVVRLANEPQGEAISFSNDGRSLWSTTEGAGAFLYTYARQ